jgi:hypothetical protein
MVDEDDRCTLVKAPDTPSVRPEIVNYLLVQVWHFYQVLEVFDVADTLKPDIDVRGKGM